MSKFWCVVKNMPGNHTVGFVKRFTDFDEARAWATVLAKKEGAEFMVMEVIGFVGPTAPPVAWTDAELQPHLPREEVVA